MNYSLSHSMDGSFQTLLKKKNVIPYTQLDLTFKQMKCVLFYRYN